MDRLGGYFGTHESDDHLDDETDDYGTGREAPPSPVGQDERRMQVRAYNHWASLLGDSRIPLVSELQPEILPDFGPYSVLLDLTGGVEDAQIAFLGHELAEECGENAIATLNEVPSRSVLSRVTDHYMQILANQAPIGFEAEFLTERGIAVQYRGILLPYSSDGTAIDHVYGVINWREVADDATADELLLEIDQALTGDDGEVAESDEGAAALDDAASPLAAMVENAYHRASAESLANDADEDPITDLEPATMNQPASRFEMPKPAFGSDEDEDEGYDASAYSPLSPSPRANRGVDALGNPLGVPVSDDNEWDAESTGDYDRGIKTAADYGLPDWDEDEGEDEDDVDGLVDPLSGETVEVHSSLMSMVSRGMKHKKSIDLSDPDAVSAWAVGGEGDNLADGQDAAYSNGHGEGYASLSPYGSEPAAAPYGSHAMDDEDEDEDEDEGSFAHAGYASLVPPAGDDFYDLSADEVDADAESEAEVEVAREIAPETDSTGDVGSWPYAPAHTDTAASFEPESIFADDEGAPVSDDEDDAAFYAAAPGYDGHDDHGDEDIAPEGLYDALASARVLAQAALTNEDRSRKTLYAAVSQAYDFSLEAQTDPAGYQELIAENGLTMQDRAPMTPIVKLVFGADYDKTRLTEYAAVLTFAHREGVERGGLANYLRHAEGGLKGIVHAERRARKEEQGKPVEEATGGIRDALARKLRMLEGVDLADVAQGEGEFALVMVRRLKGGALVVLGEVPEDVPLMEKAARKLLG